MDNNLFGETEAAPGTSAPETVESGAGAETARISTPQDNTCLIGHEAVIDQLLAWYARNALPHAMIFTGPRGIGKATSAYALARTVLQDNEAGQGGDAPTDSLFADADATQADTTAARPELLMDSDNPVFRKVAAQSHPDCLAVARNYDEKKQKPKTALDVHQIRHIQDFLHMRASSPGGRKIAIIDEGETMNRNAQNALLKVLEEPPGNSHLIIIADQLGALLATIRSRVRVMHFTPLSDADMRALLQANLAIEDSNELALIVHIAEGAVGPALELGSEEGRDIMHGVMRLVQDWPLLNWADIYNLSNRIAGKKDSTQRLRIFEYIMKWLARHMLRIKARGTRPVSALAACQFEQALASTGLDHILQICDNLNNHFDSAFHANLDKIYIVEGAFTTLTNDRAKAA